MRDFFYSKGDIFIAVLIILVAALVIYLRVGVIMGYEPFGILPDKSTAPSSSVATEPENQSPAAPETDADNADVLSEPVGDDGATDQADPEEDLPAQAVQEPEQPSNTEAAPEQSSGSIQITVVSGDAASTIADKLLNAGAIQDKQAFLSDVMAQNADSKMKQGTFTIPANSSHSDIIAILTK